MKHYKNGGILVLLKTFKRQMKKQNLQKLQAKWYRKLEQEGFQDIEESLKEHSPLKRWHSHDFRSKSVVRRYESQSKYYLDAAHFLLEGTFETLEDKKQGELEQFYPTATILTMLFFPD